MPQIFKFGGYIIFFWSNENRQTEHNPRANSTKVWITKKGKALVCNNNSYIPSVVKLYKSGVSTSEKLGIIVDIHEVKVL